MTIRRISLFCLIILISNSVFATAPLHDFLTYQGRTIAIYPEECCWLKKPRSKELDRIQKENIEQRSCSAIGGPVSKIKLEKNKLYLIGLYQCGGDLPLNQVYPQFKQPPLATWLTGTYRSDFNYLCHKGHIPISEINLTFTVKEGIVTSISTVKKDKSICKE